MSQAGEGSGESSGHVGETAGLGEAHDFGGNVKDFQSCDSAPRKAQRGNRQ